MAAPYQHMKTVDSKEDRCQVFPDILGNFYALP
jgi:hypothetical protein